jgi:hypothetical protein
MRHGSDFPQVADRGAASAELADSIFRFELELDPPSTMMGCRDHGAAGCEHP